MDRKEPPTLNLESLQGETLQDGGSASYEASQSADSSRYDPMKELAEEYERKLAVFEDEKRILIEERDDAFSRSQRDREALRRREQEIESLHQEISTLEGKIEDLKKEARNAQRAHENDLKRLNDDLAEMSEYRERYTSTSKQLDRYRMKIDELGDQQSQIESLQKELDEKTREIITLEKGHEELEIVRHQLEELKAAMAQTAADLITSQTNQAIAERELGEVRQKLQQVEREKSALDLQMSMQTEQTGILADKSVNLGGENTKDLKAQVIRLEKQLETLKGRDSDVMTRTISELRQQLDVAERTKTILQSKLEEALTHGLPVGEGLSRAEDRNEDLKEILEREKARQLAMHEVYSRVIHRLALTVKEQSIRLLELPPKVPPS